MEAPVSESEARYKSLVENAQVGIIEVDLNDRRLTSANAFVRRETGFSHEELLAMRAEDLIEAEDRPLFLDRVRRMAAGEHLSESVEFRIRTKTGEIRWALLNTTVAGENGIPGRAQVTATDITARKKAEARLAADMAALTRMHEISARLIETDGIGGILQEVMDAAVDIVGAQYGTLQLFEGDSLRIVAHHGHERPFLDFFAAAENRASVCGEATRRGERVVVEDIERSPLFAGTPSLAVLRQACVQAIQSTPLIARGGRLLGILTTQWSAPCRLDEHDLWRIDLLARQAADLIETARSEQALHESEARFRVLNETSPIGVGVSSADGVLLYTNPAYEELLGYAHGELAGKKAADLYVDPDDRTSWLTAMRQGKAVRDAEIKLQRKDGAPVWVSVSTTDIVFGGKPAVMGTIQDITERKRNEEALRQRTEELQTILDTTPAAIFMAYDPEARTISGNPAARELVELPQDMNLSKSAPPGEQPLKWKEMRDGLPIEPDDLPLQRAARGEEVRDYEMDLVFEDGTVKTVMANAAPIRDESGKSRGGVASLVNITRRKQAEERLETTLESIGDGFFAVDGDWKFVYVNATAERLLGIKRDEVLGRSHWDVFPLTLGTELERRYRLAATGQAQDWENFYEPWGRWFHNRCFPRAGGGMVVYFQDITEPKRADELRQALAEQEKLRLGAAVEQASDSVVMVDLDGTIRYVNAAFEALNRLPRAKAIGRTYFEFLAGQSAEIETIREAIGLGRYWHGLLVGSADGSRLVEIEVTISPTVDPAGTIIGGLITEKDVTRENALQNQVRQAQKMEALGTLAGGITHDFNNILGTIVLNTELALLDMSPADPARRPLPLVLQAANRGKELVKQIITFSRQRTWEKKPAAIAPIVIEGMKFLRTTLSKDIAIEERVDARSGVVLADPSHINQILVNLCQNAALAMREGGGTLRVDLAPVEVDEAMILRYPNLRPGLYARLIVSDTGCGMTKEIRERIFEPFFTTRGPGEGSGLGLAVVHGIARTYDGEITVESEPGKGSVFGVYFPRVEADVPRIDIENKDKPLRGTARILLVEDEEAQRESLRHGLVSLGYKVTVAADGLLALMAFQKDPAAFDVVVTDQIMPRMTGLELAFEIAALRPGFPVILCTGFSEKVNEANVGQSGIRELLMKPFTLREATRLIRKVLG